MLVFALLAARESAQGTSPPSTSPDSLVVTRKGAEPWHVELVLTGGFAGVRVNVNVASNGKVLVVDKKNSKEGELRLATADLVKFNELVEGLGRIQPPATTPACADCFEYELNVAFGEHHFKAMLNDTNLGTSGLEPIIDALMKLHHSALAK